MPTDLFGRWLDVPTWDQNDLITVTSVSAGPGDAHSIVQCKPKSKLKNTKALPDIKHIQFNNKTGHTAIVWSDGTSTVVKCGEDEPFERYVGFCAAVCKKLFGSTSAVKKIIETKDADLAKKRREEERQRKAEERRQEEAKNRERKLQKKEKEFRELYECIEKFMPSAPNVDELLTKLLGTGDTDGD